MAHRRAKLTPFGRLLLVHRVESEGWPVACAAGALGVSRATAYKWVRRFKEEGPAGLEDRSSAPRRSPHALPVREVRRILAARRRLKVGPHRLAPSLRRPGPRSTRSFAATASHAWATRTGPLGFPSATSGTDLVSSCTST